MVLLPCVVVMVTVPAVLSSEILMPLAARAVVRAVRAAWIWAALGSWVPAPVTVVSSAALRVRMVRFLVDWKEASSGNWAIQCSQSTATNLTN
jgi:hypothetical protein